MCKERTTIYCRDPPSITDHHSVQKTSYTSPTFDFVILFSFPFYRAEQEWLSVSNVNTKNGGAV